VNCWSVNSAEISFILKVRVGMGSLLETALGVRWARVWKWAAAGGLGSWHLTTLLVEAATATGVYNTRRLVADSRGRSRVEDWRRRTVASEIEIPLRIAALRRSTRTSRSTARVED
jgi:hypothetical protein